MKIVYSTNSICYTGGMEIIQIAKANALAAIEGNDVWIAVTDNKRPPVLDLDDRVHLVNLDVNYYEDDWKSRWHVLKGILVKRRIHRERLQELLNSIQPDVVITQGRSDKYFLPKIKIISNPVLIREIHGPTNYRSMEANGLIRKLVAWMEGIYDYMYSIIRYDRIVLLTDEDKERFWKHINKAIVIPNPLTIDHKRQSDLRNKKVMSLGRLSKNKNFASLIRSWAIVYQLHSDWSLEICGKGEEKENLLQLIEDLHLNDSVSLLGYVNDAIDQYVSSSIFVLSSKFEGFGLVLTEAMSCGLPVVAYECPCGPKDIISEGKDGFLVPLGDELILAERICYLIEHKDFRMQMGVEALKKSEQYSINVIIEKWMKLFEVLMD